MIFVFLYFSQYLQSPSKSKSLPPQYFLPTFHQVLSCVSQRFDPLLHLHPALHIDIIGHLQAFLVGPFFHCLIIRNRNASNFRWSLLNFDRRLSLVVLDLLLVPSIFPTLRFSHQSFHHLFFLLFSLVTLELFLSGLHQILESKALIDQAPSQSKIGLIIELAFQKFKSDLIGLIT